VLDLDSHHSDELYALLRGGLGVDLLTQLNLITVPVFLSIPVYSKRLSSLHDACVAVRSFNKQSKVQIEGIEFFINDVERVEHSKGNYWWKNASRGDDAVDDEFEDGVLTAVMFCNSLLNNSSISISVPDFFKLEAFELLNVLSEEDLVDYITVRLPSLISVDWEDIGKYFGEVPIEFLAESSDDGNELLEIFEDTVSLAGVSYPYQKEVSKEIEMGMNVQCTLDDRMVVIDNIPQSVQCVMRYDTAESYRIENNPHFMLERKDSRSVSIGLYESYLTQHICLGKLTSSPIVCEGI